MLFRLMGGHRGGVPGHGDRLALPVAASPSQSAIVTKDTRCLQIRAQPHDQTGQLAQDHHSGHRQHHTDAGAVHQCKDLAFQFARPVTAQVGPAPGILSG